MRKTLRRPLLFAVACTLTGLLAQPRPPGPSTAEAGVVAGVPAARARARATPSLREPLVSRPLRLEVQISADHWQGDIHIPERWGTEKGLEGPGMVHFRYTQTGSAPSTVTCQVFGGLVMSRTGARVRPLVSVELGPPPGQGKVHEFDVDLTGKLPAQPNGRTYTVRLVGPNAAGTVSVWSREVKLTYKQQEVTQFPTPVLKRVLGSADAEGKPLTWSNTPLALANQVFRVEGPDLWDPTGTVVQFLKNGQVLKEAAPIAAQTQELPSGEDSVAVKAAALAPDLYQVRVKSGGWGVTAALPVYIGGGEDGDDQFVGYVSNQEDRFVDYVGGFRDEFGDTWPCTQYYWGEARFLGADRLAFADSADLAYIAGHGSSSHITMSEGQGVWLPDVALGSYASLDHRGDLEYIVFHSCTVLDMDAGFWDRWFQSSPGQKRPFSGLHVAMGFRTTHHNGLGAGWWAADEFAENLEEGYSVREAWYEAAEDARFLAGWEDNKPAVFYLQPHRDEPVSAHNSPDYEYGDAGYAPEAYYME